MMNVSEERKMKSPPALALVLVVMAVTVPPWEHNIMLEELSRPAIRFQRETTPKRNTQRNHNYRAHLTRTGQDRRDCTRYHYYHYDSPRCIRYITSRAPLFTFTSESVTATLLPPRSSVIPEESSVILF